MAVTGRMAASVERLEGAFSVPTPGGPSFDPGEAAPDVRTVWFSPAR